MIMTWPSEFPPPERDSWQMTRQDARRRRQSETGPPSFRRRFSSAARLVSMSLVLSRAQRSIFDNFYEHDCVDGTRMFRMPDPATDGWAMLDENYTPLLDETGRPLLLSARWLCAWGDQMPVETVVEQVKFRKTFNIVVIR